MQTLSLLLSLLFLSSTVTPLPTNTLTPRNPSQCDPFSSISTGTYTIYSNEWGAQASEGSQCSTINGLSGNTLSWSTTWNWINDTNLNQVKSFTNVQSSSLACKPLSQYQSIPTSWSWSYTGTNLRANVAYDTFLAPSCSTPPSSSYEVMIWLASYGGISPLSSSGYPPHPTATPTINGVPFNLILGTNGATKVFSFVAVQSASEFRGDLMAFYRYLEEEQGVVGLGGMDLVSVQAGTEVFSGEGGGFVTGGYSVGGE